MILDTADAPAAMPYFTASSISLPFESFNIIRATKTPTSLFSIWQNPMTKKTVLKRN